MGNYLLKKLRLTINLVVNFIIDYLVFFYEQKD